MHQDTGPIAEDPKLQEVIRRMVLLLRPVRGYLFGSRGRGQPGPDSDYDLLFVVPDDSDPELRSGRKVYSALRGTGTAVDVIVMTESHFNRKIRVVSSLPATVEREGRLIYAA